MSAAPVAARRISARVEGVVQGVGFRPFVFRLAEELALGGFVRNDTRGVVLEVEGEPGAVERFLAALAERAPPLARVERVTVRELAPEGARDFAIAHSDAGGAPGALVSADSATCADCLAELHDPADRRYRYPFVNCTNCGPRFTIVRGVPYDRPLTTMAGFAMCPACQAEYDDPRDRRFHAQPNACPACGPRARLLGGAGGESVDAVAGAAALLRDGAIVAVKGLGGYHLACRADHEEAVAALRSRKHREDRPFALMARDLAGGRELVELTPAHEELLTSPARPIVLAARRAGARVAGAVAPGLGELGVMLPYSPLHHLLLAGAGGPLVLTSGNVSDEPIAFRDEDALERLAPIADAFLVHDRPIHTRTDDSVARVAAGRPLVLRRSRGLVPEALALPVACARPLLACGAELKSTFCLAKGARAWLGHHIGDLRNADTLASFTEGIAHFEALFAVAPEVVAHDLHPEYLSTAYALEREGVRLVGVQHHHAHLAACLAEHGQAGPAVGAIYDGTGHGSDGTAWGGELLAGDLRGFERAGHLLAVRLPGGDRAVREPWRMACAWLVAACGPEPALPRMLAGAIPPERWEAVARMAETGFAAPLTTSMGRLFDAVAALCGLRTTVSYEGQAAIELEALADATEPGAYALPLEDAPDGAFVLDARVTIREVLADLERGATPAVMSARFHRAVAGATAGACARAAEAAGTDRAVLSGGVFQNRLLLERTAAELEASGLSVLAPERVPPNDGGIAYGQAAIAAASG
ncbi:MAG: hypF [Solirubrobacterales bacterium]|nr:hypF [Solirubrobacterales bacterium]